MRLYMVIFVLSVAVIALTTGAPANDRANEYDYEDESEPAPAPAPVSRGRLSLLNTRGARAPLIGRGPATKQTTSKPTESPEPVEEEVLEEEGEEGADDVAVTTTTEAPKKSLVRGGVRPFRSNEDLLAALKRRREQQIHGSGGSPKVLQVYPTPASAAAPEEKTVRATTNQTRTGRRGFNGKASAAAGSSSDPIIAEQSEPSRRTTSRKFSSRSKPAENTEVEEETTQRAKTTFRRRN